MNKKKRIAAVIAAVAVASLTLALPVSAQQLPVIQVNTVKSSNAIISPFWDIAYSADLDLTVSGNSAKAKVTLSKPSAASASISTVIYYRASSRSNWVRAASSSSSSVSCTAKPGYQYKAESTVKLTMNGKTETIPLSDGPYTA